MVRVLLAALAALAVSAVPADAEEVVARKGGYVLTASTERDGICVRVSGRGAGQSGCGSVPVLDRLRMLVQAPADPRRRSGAFAAAVPPEVTEVGLDGARVPTHAAAGLPARFVLAPGRARAGLIRLYTGDRLVAAVKNEYAQTRRATLVAYRSGGVKLVLHRDFELREDLLELDRTVATTCVLAVTLPDGSSSEDCRPGAPPLAVTPTCAPARPVLHGVLAPSVRRVDVRLGDGRRLRAPARSLGAAYDNRRFVALPVPAGVAVRFAVLRDIDGKRLGRRMLRQAPTGLPCEDGLLSASSSSFVAIRDGRHGRPDTVPVDVGGHTLAIGDRGRDLCVDTVPSRRGCAPPPVYPGDVQFRRRGDLVLGVVPAAVAGVELVLAGGDRRTVTADAGPAYGGRFAGLVRFVAAEVPLPQRVARAVLLGADGRRLTRSYVSRFARRPPRRVPGTPLTAHTILTGTDVRVAPVTCLRGARAGVCGPGGYVASVGCRPARIRVTGVLGRRTRGLVLVLADGRRLRTRAVRVAGLRVVHAAVPRGAGLRAVRFRGRPSRFTPRRVPLALPPAGQQCGYATDISG